MASSRPSAFKQGGSGGFLNNVDVTWDDYEFTTDFPGSTGGGKSRDDDYSPLYGVLTFSVDGADEPVTTTLYFGNANDFTIENEGKTLVSIDDDTQVPLNQPFGRFINSLCENGFDDSLFPEENVNYEAALGTRLRLKQVDEVDKDGKVKKRVAKKGKYKGKEFPVQNPQVVRVYEAEAKPTKAIATKGGTKAAPVKGGKAKAVESDEPDLNAIGVETLLALLRKQKGNTIQKRSLTVPISTLLGKHPERENVRRLVFSDDFLETQQGWSYNKASKTQDITLDKE